MMVAERVEFLVDAVFAVDDQGLMLRDVVLLAEVLENRRNLGLEAVGEWLVRDILVMIVLAGEDVERSLAVAGLNPLGRLDLHVCEEDALLQSQLVDKRTESLVRIVD